MAIAAMHGAKPNLDQDWFKSPLPPTPRGNYVERIAFPDKRRPTLRIWLCNSMSAESNMQNTSVSRTKNRRSFGSRTFRCCANRRHDSSVVNAPAFWKLLGICVQINLDFHWPYTCHNGCFRALALYPWLEKSSREAIGRRAHPTYFCVCFNTEISRAGGKNTNMGMNRTDPYGCALLWLCCSTALYCLRRKLSGLEDANKKQAPLA